MLIQNFNLLQDVSHKFIIAVLMEYIRSLNQNQITVQVKHGRVSTPASRFPVFDASASDWLQHYLYELVIKTLVQNNLFYMLHQFLQYHVLSDSKPLVRTSARRRQHHAEGGSDPTQLVLFGSVFQACLLLSLESTYPPAHQLSLDMLKVQNRTGTGPEPTRTSPRYTLTFCPSC